MEMMKQTDLDIRAPFVWLPLLLFSLMLAAIYLTDQNVQLFLAVNTLSDYTGPRVWAGITMLGDTLVALLIVLPFIRKNSRAIWSLIFALLIALLISHGLKNLFMIKRPPAVLDAGDFTLIGPKLQRRAFPSGHATMVFTLGIILYYYYKNGMLRVLVVFTATLIALSRVVVGVHWPADVVAGAMAGWLSGIGGLMICIKWQYKLIRIKNLWIMILFIVLFSIIIFRYI